MFAQLARTDSPIRRRLLLEHLHARAAVDADELPGPAPLIDSRRPDPWELRRERESIEIERLETEEATRVPGIAGGLAAAGALSRLESLGLSDPRREASDSVLGGRPPVDDGIHLPPTADPWRREVEVLTAPFRRSRASAARHRAALALRGLRPPAPPKDPTADPWPDGPTPIELDEEDFARLLGPWVDELDDQGAPIPLAPGLAFALDHALRDKQVRIARWHWRRSRGQLDRFAAVESCSVGAIRSHCRACGVVHDAPHRCGIGRLCLSCRGLQKRQRHARLYAAQLEEVTGAVRAQLNRGPNRWAQRHVTLTIPHDPGTRIGDEHDGPLSVVLDRARLLRRAWRRFSLRLREWTREVTKRDGRKVHFYRAFEWTPGGDGYGHPHFHVWIHCPMLWEADVARWWAEALTAAGRPIGPNEVIVSVRGCDSVRAAAAELTKGTLTALDASRLRAIGVDPRAVESGRHLLGYIEGWSLVDQDADGNPIDPAVAAALYAALEGARLVQSSKGFLAPRERGCAHCGELRSVQTTVDRRPAAMRHASSVTHVGSGADPPT